MVPVNGLPRWIIVIALVALCLIASAFVGAVIIEGKTQDLSAPAVLTVLGLFTMIVTQLLLAIQASHNASGIQAIQQTTAETAAKVNGHLAAHMNGQSTVPPGPGDPPALGSGGESAMMGPLP